MKKRKTILAIDYSHSFLEIVNLEKISNRYKLLNYDIRRLPQQDIQATSVNFINNFIKKNSITVKDIIISISEAESVAVEYLTLPVLPESEIITAAKWQLKEEINFDIEDACIDWQIVKEFTDEQGTKKRGIIFIVIKKESVNQCLAIVNQCLLHPVCITSSSFNYANVLKSLPGNPPISAVLDIDYKEATLNIYNENKLNFVRKIPVSWEKLTQSLTEIFVSDKGKIELTNEEAENLKNNVGIPHDHNQHIRDDIRGSNVISSIRPLLEVLVRELRFSFDYFTSNFDLDRPSSLYITGGGASLKHLDKHLSKEFNMDVSYLTFPACFDAQSLREVNLPRTAQNRIMNAVGGAMGESQKINLLPLEIKTHKADVIQRIILKLIIFTLGMTFLFSILLSNIMLRDFQGRVKNAQIHLETIGGIKDLKQKIKIREGLIEGIHRGRVPTEGILRLVSVLVPGNVVLDELYFDQSSQIVMLKGTVIASEDTTERVLIEFMEDLEASSFFNEASLIASNRQGLLQKFEIKCDFVE